MVRVLTASESSLLAQQPAPIESNAVDFARIATLLAQRSGVPNGSGCNEALRTRVSAFAAEHGLARLESLIAEIENGDTSAIEELSRLLAFGCNGFFRDPEQFQILAHHLRSRPAFRPIEIWCATCASGEELYSIIMTACEVFGTLTPPIQVVASDHDAAMLALAREAKYTREQVESLPTPIRRRFFRTVSGHGDIVQVRPELRDFITFRQVDLRAPVWPTRPHFDVIFCRYTLPVLDWQVQANALANFDTLLDDEGLLFVPRHYELARANSTLHKFADGVFGKTV